MTIYYTENEKDFSLLMQKLEERGIVHAPTHVRPTQVSFSDFSLANNCVRVDNNEKVFHVAAKEYYETKPFISLYFSTYIILHTRNLKGDFTGNWYNFFYNIDTWYKVI